jgi:hypothetical protein
MLLVFSALGSWGWSQHAALGVSAAAVATCVCWLSGLGALGAMVLFRNPQQAVAGVFLGMLFRLGAPLVVGFGLLQSGSSLLTAGVLGMMVIAYLAGLLIETAMAWWILGRSLDDSLPGVAKAS